MLRAPITQPIDATSSVALVLDGPFAHGFADRAERRLLEFSRLSRSRPGVESAGVSFWVSDTSVYLLR